MTAQTFYCLSSWGTPKETFPSEHAARKALQLKRSFRSRRFPRVYHCPCGRYHLTGSER